mgnify:FL=1
MSLKIRKTTVLYFVLFVMADHCLWLLSGNVQSKVNELCWIIIFALFLFKFINTNFSQLFNKQKYQFGRIILFTVIMGIYSTLQSYYLHGQSLIQGILPQRFMIGGFFLYFILMKYINEKKYGMKNIEKIFLTIGYCELILYISQYFLINKIQFLQINYTMRLGEIRMNLGAIGVPYVIFYSLNQLFGEKKSWKSIVSIAMGIFYVVVIAKTRIALLAYIISIIGGFMMWKKGGKKKIVIFFLLLTLIVVLTQTELFSYLTDGLKGIDLSTQTRQLGRAYYLKKILSHPILGCGYINTNNVAASRYAGIYSISTGIIAWVDLGVYGLTFFFGIVGLVWFLVLYGKLAMRSYKIGCTGKQTYWMYMLYIIVVSPNSTGFLWYISSTIAFVIWMCLIEKEYRDIIMKRKN